MNDRDRLIALSDLLAECHTRAVSAEDAHDRLAERFAALQAELDELKGSE